MSGGLAELRLNYGHKWAFIGLKLWFKNNFRSTHEAKEHLFSMFRSILTFDFDLIYRFWLSGAHMGFFGGWYKVPKLFWGLLI